MNCTERLIEVKVSNNSSRLYSVVNSVVSSNYCKLCLTEKFYIIESLCDKNLLNAKYELVSKCRHQNKLLLCNVKRNYSMD